VLDCTKLSLTSPAGGRPQQICDSFSNVNGAVVLDARRQGTTEQ
jgi:hypothetical protein